MTTSESRSWASSDYDNRVPRPWLKPSLSLLSFLEGGSSETRPDRRLRARKAKGKTPPVCVDRSRLMGNPAIRPYSVLRSAFTPWLSGGPM